ncbi:ATP-dependent DNA helicase Q1-like isoform X2 [Artemia franciscana]|uniref:ATP-dependent DNA helicase Q1-like isoform X2 n=1 Tax=Artemia franciscana TaxID=6661 RepID=UPI0032DBB923
MKMASSDEDLMEVTPTINDPEQHVMKVTLEIESLDGEIAELQRKRRLLVQKKDKLIEAANNKKTAKLAALNWNSEDYAWSKKLKETMNNVFGISSLRPHQLPTMNASLSGQDVILLMPTGGGKSLCFQLPAVISSGFTLVVSPLVALMEDQIMALKKKNIDAEMISASTPKDKVTQFQNAMIDKLSSMKLLYVTPEKLAKSKRFMAKLQKAHEMKRLDRIAIDEVHCCSQWGHDFRKDYKFLGVLKNLFPKVPIIGLTATAPSRVLADVQKILNIEGCLVFRASFNRPNLYYEVRPKPASHKECVDELEKLLTTKYRGQSGIIYSTSIKDTEELMKDLRSRGLKVGCYHANLSPEMRSKCHQKWISNYYQAVIATIAFGMGMDKPDVRFVIHHSISKSMANFYQESGRAGRDDSPADCILYYRFGDLFRISTMVFAEATGLENVYGMVSYCIDSKRCRRHIIAEHFEEIWESVDCDKMCDHCRYPKTVKLVDITNYTRDLGKVLSNAKAAQQKVTGPKLVDAWLGKGQSNLKVAGLKAPPLGRESCENVVSYLLLEGFLKEDFHFTPYNTISYVLAGFMVTIFD